MAHLAASLRVIAYFLSPVMTHAPKQILSQLGLTFDDDINLKELTMASLPKNSKVVEKGTPIFPRRDAKEEVAFIAAQMTKSDKKKGRAAMELLNRPLTLVFGTQKTRN